MKVRELVAARTRQAQEKLSTFVTSIGAVNETRAALARARDEGRRLRTTLQGLGTVTRMRTGIHSLSTGATQRVSAVQQLGNVARTDISTIVNELRVSVKRIVPGPKPEPLDVEPTSERHAIGS